MQAGSFKLDLHIESSPKQSIIYTIMRAHGLVWIVLVCLHRCCIMWLSWCPGISLGMCLANEICCYNKMTSLTGWAHTKTDPWMSQYVLPMLTLLVLKQEYCRRIGSKLLLVLLYWTGLTLVPAWISNCMPSKMWDKLLIHSHATMVVTVEVWKWMNNFIWHFIMGVIAYPCWD